MTAVPTPDDQSFELTFELPDPNGTRMWRVHSICDEHGMHCEFRAESGQQVHVSNWRTLERPGHKYWEFNREKVGTGSERLARACAGFVRIYRRGFAQTLTSIDNRHDIPAGDIFDPPHEPEVVALVVREIEAVLFILAQVRGMAAVLEQTGTTTLPLPGDHAWEQYEPLIAASADTLAQRLYPLLGAFYLKYGELRDQLGQPTFSFLTQPSRSRVPAIITRLDILGTQAIWALEDARRAEFSETVRSGWASVLDGNGGLPSWPQERAVHMERIVLDNIRRFDKLTLHLQCPSDDGIGQWLVLLGENGTGKTTLLRAIALALTEVDFAQSFVTQISADAPLVRTDAAGSKGGPPFRFAAGIEVTLHPGMSSHVLLALVPGRERLEVNLPLEVRPPVFAYGCRRGNALGGPEREVDFNPLGNVATLFDPQAHLVHAEAWLRKLAFAAGMDSRDDELFEAVLDLLTDRDGTKEDPLLPGVREIEVTPDRTWVLGPGERRVPLSALSDGYLTTLGWLVDFLARWLEYARRSDYEVGPGFAAEMPAVVLVDELDLHLHPRWQMRVVPALARTFPRTTFIATTHNPLTLSGMVGDERMRGAVHIIKERADGNLEIIQRDLEPGMSADEVLTHEWFGLRSTLDRDTLELLDKHRALLRLGVAEAHPERRELEAELRRRLGSYADTPAERLAQELVAEQFPDEVPEVDKLSNEERDRLSKLYEAAVAQARSEGKNPPEQP